LEPGLKNATVAVFCRNLHVPVDWNLQKANNEVTGQLVAIHAGAGIETPDVT
jgi:hypothetical protein